MSSTVQRIVGKNGLVGPYYCQELLFEFSELTLLGVPQNMAFSVTRFAKHNVNILFYAMKVLSMTVILACHFKYVELLCI